MKNVTDAEFKTELTNRGFRMVVPGDPNFTIWGLIDIGGSLVNRWQGGSTNAEQLAYLIKCRAAIGSPATKATKTTAPKRPALKVVAKPAAKQAKKAVKKVAKKGAVR